MLAVLSAATVLAVALTRAGLNLLVSLLVAAAVIGVHAAFRVNYYLDERDAFDVAGGSLMDNGYGYTVPKMIEAEAIQLMRLLLIVFLDEAGDSSFLVVLIHPWDFGRCSLKL